MSHQLVQIAGALLSMGAFALLHFEIASSSALRYLVPNLLGSVALVITAWLDRQFGFVILESSWIVIATHAIAVRMRRKPGS